MKTQPDTRMPIGHIVIYEDWNQDNDGCIWYRWRREGEQRWHAELTPLKQKPFVSYKYISPQEYDDKLGTRVNDVVAPDKESDSE